MQDAWIQALVGGGFIGLSATILLLVSGRISGVSGIFFGVIHPQKGEFHWRMTFVVGLLLGGFLASFEISEPFVNNSGRPLAAILAAGFLVGFGTKLGSGCTSGHGVCGISRLSPRSIVATLVFMMTGIITVLLASSLWGGN